MRYLITSLVFFLLPLVSVAQFTSRTASATPTFGRHTNCSAGRGACGITIEPSNGKPANTFSKTMSEHSFILTISRKSLLREDEIRIAGKPFNEIRDDDQLLFVQEDILLVSKLSLEHLNLDSATNKIYPGNYPMFLSKDKVEILFTLKN